MKQSTTRSVKPATKESPEVSKDRKAPSPVLGKDKDKPPRVTDTDEVQQKDSDDDYERDFEKPDEAEQKPAK